MKKRKKSFFARVQETDTLLNELSRIPKITNDGYFTITELTRIASQPGVKRHRGVRDFNIGLLEKGDEFVCFEIDGGRVRLITQEEGMLKSVQLVRGKLEIDPVWGALNG